MIRFQDLSQSIPLTSMIGLFHDSLYTWLHDAKNIVLIYFISYRKMGKWFTFGIRVNRSHYKVWLDYFTIYYAQNLWCQRIVFIYFITYQKNEEIIYCQDSSQSVHLQSTIWLFQDSLCTTYEYIMPKLV